MAMYFKEFFKKHPMEFTEHYVIKLIHKKIECCEKELKKHPDGNGHVKYAVMAYNMLEDYFREKGIDPTRYA